MKRVALMMLGGMAVSRPVLADIAANGMEDRIAAHFEASSSRLRPEDADAIERFVLRARNVPGAKLTILVPDTTELARTRFVAARIAELERHVPSLPEVAEYSRVAGGGRGDVLWLTVAVPEQPVVSEPTTLSKRPGSASAAEPSALSPPIPSAIRPPVVTAADLQLTDWVVRGVRHPSQGPAYAYVARAGADAAPHEVAEAQTDKDLGLIKEISLSPQGRWIVRTEIGWIGQPAP